MSFEISLNIAGILSAALVCFAFLALWFSPALFGPLLEKVRDRPIPPPTLGRFGAQALCLILFCIVMEVFVDSIGAAGMRQGIAVGVEVWMMISLMYLLSSSRFDLRSLVVKGVTSAYILVASVIVATLLSMWR